MTDDHASSAPGFESRERAAGSTLKPLGTAPCEPPRQQFNVKLFLVGVLMLVAADLFAEKAASRELVRDATDRQEALNLARRDVFRGIAAVPLFVLCAGLIWRARRQGKASVDVAVGISVLPLLKMVTAVLVLIVAPGVAVNSESSLPWTSASEYRSSNLVWWAVGVIWVLVLSFRRSTGHGGSRAAA